MVLCWNQLSDIQLLHEILVDFTHGILTLDWLTTLTWLLVSWTGFLLLCQYMEVGDLDCYLLVYDMPFL